MASRPSRLANIGRESFPLVDIYYGEGTFGPAPKKQYNVPTQYAPIPSDENVIDSKKAAQKYRGMLVVDYCKKKFGGWRS
ncbi:hypothetical protein ACJRO7_032453 [Eucalyptus globulus]|uniref:Uncharacterized protein n=1 Tax=Eucalyptus globulus TaxID=34317 RepID=A0ABD3JL74_EUCGL